MPNLQQALAILTEQLRLPDWAQESRQQPGAEPFLQPTRAPGLHEVSVP